MDPGDAHPGDHMSRAHRVRPGAAGADPLSVDDRLHLNVWPVPSIDTKVDPDLAQDSYLVTVATVTLRLLTAICAVRLVVALLDVALTVGVSGASIGYASGVFWGLVHVWFSLALTGLECYVGNIGVEERDQHGFFYLSFLTWLPILLFVDIVLSVFAHVAVVEDGDSGTWATIQSVARIAVLVALALALVGSVLLKLAMDSALERIRTGQGV
jgi:hypothetical protein